MVTLLLDATRLEVVLSPIERALARRSDPVHVDRSHITKVQLTDDAWTWLRGVPNPGTHLRGTVAMGTWRSAGAADFVVVRRLGQGLLRTQQLVQAQVAAVGQPPFQIGVDAGFQVTQVLVDGHGDANGSGRSG